MSKYPLILNVTIGKLSIQLPQLYNGERRSSLIPLLVTFMSFRGREVIKLLLLQYYCVGDNFLFSFSN